MTQEIALRDENAVALALPPDPFSADANVAHIETPHIPVIKIQSQTASWDFGEENYKKTFDAIIVDDTKLRTWWEKPLSDGGGGSRPDCFSTDGKTPSPRSVKKQSDACATCPKNEWGSGKGKGKACQEKRLVFVVEPGEQWPSVIRLPSTSITPLDRYYSGLTKAKKGFRGVITRFSVIPVMEPVKHGRAKLDYVSDSSDEDRAAVRQLLPMIPGIKESIVGRDEAAPAQGGVVDTEVVEPDTSFDFKE